MVGSGQAAGRALRHIASLAAGGPHQRPPGDRRSMIRTSIMGRNIRPRRRKRGQKSVTRIEALPAASTSIVSTIGGVGDVAAVHCAQVRELEAEDTVIRISASSADSRAEKTGSPSGRGRQHQTIERFSVDQRRDLAVADGGQFQGRRLHRAGSRSLRGKAAQPVARPRQDRPGASAQTPDRPRRCRRRHCGAPPRSRRSR